MKQWLVFVSVLLIAACATWREDVNKSLMYAHEAGVAARETVSPIINKACRARAESCQGMGQDSPECAPWRECEETRKALTSALLSLQFAIRDAKIAIAINDEQGAWSTIEQAESLLVSIRRQVQEVTELWDN